jgi:uncharacterized YigZ family protein
MSADHYRTPAAPAEARQKIERSEFLGLVFPVTTEEAFFEELQRIEKRFFDATHHCWAFRLWSGRSRSSDAGEPSGTAGKPILTAIEGADLFDCGVVVVRWYGGVKLGTGGLSRAYRETAAEALRATTRLDRYVYTRFRLDVPFDILGTVYRFVAPPDVVLVAENFGETNTFDFDVRESMAEQFGKVLTEKRIRWQLAVGSGQ